MSLLAIADYGSDSDDGDSACNSGLISSTVSLDSTSIPPSITSQNENTQKVNNYSVVSTPMVDEQGAIQNHRITQNNIDRDVVDRINNYWDMKVEANFNILESIKATKSFCNPYILKTVVEYFNIEENGSNIPKHIYNLGEHFKLNEDSLDMITRLSSNGTTANAPYMPDVSVRSDFGQKQVSTQPASSQPSLIVNRSAPSINMASTNLHAVGNLVRSISNDSLASSAVPSAVPLVGAVVNTINNNDIVGKKRKSRWDHHNV
jgi:hypothetical protein